MGKGGGQTTRKAEKVVAVVFNRWMHDVNHLFHSCVEFSVSCCGHVSSASWTTLFAKKVNQKQDSKKVLLRSSLFKKEVRIFNLGKIRQGQTRSFVEEWLF